jgi:hypothetical protein
VLGPDRLPAGVTITTEACVAYINATCAFPEALDETVYPWIVRREPTRSKISPAAFRSAAHCVRKASACSSVSKPTHVCLPVRVSR